MVTDSESAGPGSVSRPCDRGQLLLVGALAIAFILLGIVVVFNGVLYTETIAASATSQSAGSAQVAEYELADGLDELATRSYNETSGTFEREDGTALTDDDVTTFVEAIGDSIGSSRSAGVAVDSETVSIDHGSPAITVTVTYATADVERTVTIVAEPEGF